MQTRLDRRCFLLSCATATSGLLLPTLPTPAVEPFRRSSAPRLNLSLAAYSFRNYFRDRNHEADAPTQPGKQMDLFQFIDFCADHGCAGAELTSYYFPPKLNAEFLIKVRRHAFLRGVAVSGTAVGNTFTLPPGPKRDEEIDHVKSWIDHAALLGAPHVRIFAGNAAKGVSHAESKRLCLAALEECAEHAGKRGIFLGLENHGGIVAEAADLLDLVRSAQSPWVGINLDTGNFHTADPYADLAACAPYAVNVQVKAEMHPRNGGEIRADLPRLVKILRDARYQGYVALEYESKADPFDAVPRLLQELKQLL